MIDKKEQGKKNRKSGAAFELKVRKDLGNKGWIVAKWTNNVEFGTYTKGSFNELEPRAWKDLTLQNGEHYPGPCARLIPAKRKYNPFKKALSIGVGFPDFICFRELKLSSEDAIINQKVMIFEVIGLEAKSNGYLDKEEKSKCNWMLDNHIFSKILIAKKEGKDIIYTEFKAKSI